MVVSVLSDIAESALIDQTILVPHCAAVGCQNNAQNCADAVTFHKSVVFKMSYVIGCQLFLVQCQRTERVVVDPLLVE